MTSTVPRQWWDSIRADLMLHVDDARQHNLGWGVDPKQKTWAKARARAAVWLLARMDELEHHLTLDAALDAREEQAARHPKVTWINAITSCPTVSESRCFASEADAFAAAVKERPYNNTMLSLRWCTEDHSSESAADSRRT